MGKGVSVKKLPQSKIPNFAKIVLRPVPDRVNRLGFSR